MERDQEAWNLESHDLGLSYMNPPSPCDGVSAGLPPTHWQFGFSPASPSSPWPATLPSFLTLSKHWMWVREGWSQVHTQQSWHKPGSHHPTAVGLQHKPWTQQVQASHSPPVQTWWVPVWRLWSQGIAYLPLLEWAEPRVGQSLAHPPRPHLNMEYCFSDWWEGEPGRGWATESQGRVSSSPANISMPKGVRHHTANSNTTADGERLQRKNKAWYSRAIFSIFELRSPQLYFSLDPENHAASLVSGEEVILPWNTEWD